VNLVQVGMDVCNKVKLSKAQLAQIYERKNLKTKLLSIVSPQLREFYVSQGDHRLRRSNCCWGVGLMLLMTYHESTGRFSEDDGIQYNDVPAVAYVIDSKKYFPR